MVCGPWSVVISSFAFNQIGKRQFHLYTAFAAQQFMPFIHSHYAQVLKKSGMSFHGQQQVQAFGCNDEYLGHLLFLACPFRIVCVAIADTNFPGQSQCLYHFGHGAAQVFGQGSQWRHPQQLQSVVALRLPIGGVFIDELNDAAEENRKGFTTTGGCIDKPAFTVDNVLPGFLLKSEGLQTLLLQPLRYNLPSRR